MTTREAKLNEKRAEALEPDTRSLLETIESFHQRRDMIRKVRIIVRRRPFYINIFSVNTIEECILDFKLTKRPFVGHNNRKYNMDSGSLDNKRAVRCLIDPLGRYLVQNIHLETTVLICRSRDQN